MSDDIEIITKYISVWGWFIVSQIYFVGMMILISIGEFLIAGVVVIPLIYCIWSLANRRKSLLNEIPEENE